MGREVHFGEIVAARLQVCRRTTGFLEGPHRRFHAAGFADADVDADADADADVDAGVVTKIIK